MTNQLFIIILLLYNYIYLIVTDIINYLQSSIKGEYSNKTILLTFCCYQIII
jgi:hypothetical protein